MTRSASWVLCGVLLVLASPPAQGETITFNLKQGWNLIAFPVVPATQETAGSIGRSINDQGGLANRVMRWDGSGWQTHLVGQPFGDFPIEEKEGYFILCDSASTWHIEGEPVTEITHTLHLGWNLVSVPFDQVFSAETLGESMNHQGGRVNRVMRWDGSGWQTHLVGMPFGNFPIRKGEGFFVKTDGPSAWYFGTARPAPPVLNPFASPTRVSRLTITGAKEPATSVWMNGSQIIPISAGTTWSHTLNLQEGANRLSLVTRNAAGVESAPPLEASIILDTIPPVISILSPRPGTILGALQATVEYTIDGQPKSRLVNLTEGENTVEIAEQDAAGNSSRATIMLISDMTPPRINLVLVNQRSYYPGDTVNVDVTAQDAPWSTLRLRYLLDSAVLSDWSTSLTFNWTALDQSSGLHLLTVEVQDNAGWIARQGTEIMGYRSVPRPTRP